MVISKADVELIVSVVPIEQFLEIFFLLFRSLFI